MSSTTVSSKKADDGFFRIFSKTSFPPTIPNGLLLSSVTTRESVKDSK